ncbi:hypothetical protein [Halobacillus litoralis]|uniref:hypothetical protein n=1 Tax=Halobacillus litoralis TaxID=45668 RepID=UPI001CD34397|nr:hypothetical protein [Halobacillus litoralis]MCA1021781.1 hypothetical protein [Halobacillus litoralis]
MKKIGFVLLIGLLIACGDTQSQEGSPESESEQTEQNQESEKAAAENSNSSEEIEIEIDMEMPQVATYAWISEDSGIGWLSFYAIIENTGNTPFSMEESSVTYYNKEDEVIAVSATGIDVVPSIIQPGEQAYVSVYEQLGEESPENFKSAELSPAPVTVDYELEEVSTETSLQDVAVTGTFTEEIDPDMIEMSSALFDKDDQLLGILDAGQITAKSFELFDPPFPDEAKDAIDHEKTKAYR